MNEGNGNRCLRCKESKPDSEMEQQERFGSRWICKECLRAEEDYWNSLGPTEGGLLDPDHQPTDCGFAKGDRAPLDDRARDVQHRLYLHRLNNGV